MQIAVDVCVKRYYRYYLDVPENASIESIQCAAKSELSYMPTDKLEEYSDPDMDVEPGDIVGVSVDEDSPQWLN